MELNLKRRRALSIELPGEYRLVGWHESLVPAHAEVKYQCFRDEIDSQLFPCLGELEGCQRLMAEIGSKDGFVPEATWLVEYVGAGPRRTEYCGTIQAVRTQRRWATIQNIGITPFHRGRGIGKSLVSAALLGFEQVGIQRAGLEVTAENDIAIRLYRRLGFRTVRTLYKTVELAHSEAAR